MSIISPRYSKAPIKLCKKMISNKNWLFITKLCKSKSKEEKIYIKEKFI